MLSRHVWVVDLSLVFKKYSYNVPGCFSSFMTVLLNYLTSACDHSYARILRWIRTISSFWLKWISPVARHVTAESKGTIEFWSAFACHVFDLHAAQTTNDFLFWLALFLYFFKIVLQTDLCRHSRRLVRSSYNRGLAIVPARGPKIHRYRITSYKRTIDICLNLQCNLES